MRRVISVVAACALLACAKSGSNVTTEGPPADCSELVNAIADAYARCGQDRATTYQTQLSAIASGDCNTILAVRDRDALQATCIPSLATISCTDLLSAKLDETCKLQLQRTLSIAP